MRYQVFYRVEATFREDKSLTVDDVSTKFKMVAVVEAENNDDVFYKMQGEVWSPLGEARPLIRALGLRHTSMSVGDVVCLNGLFQECTIEGWRTIG